LSAPSGQPTGAVPRRSFAALRHRGFQAFFLGTAAAMMADNVEHVISYWVMFQKFHSPELGGFAVISHWLPFLLFSAYAGALADRFDRRRLIQLGMVLFMAVSVTWGVLFATDTLTPTYAKALLVTHGIAGVLWNPTSQLLLHDIVGPEQLPSAVRLNATARYLGVFVGPAVGAGLLLVLGPARGILLNALIYLPLTLWLWRAPYGPRSRNPPHARAAVRGFADVIATVRAIGADQTIIAMTALAGAASLFVGQAYQAQMPGFALDLGHGNPGVAYWALLSADAGGALLAGVVLESRGLLQPRARTALVLALLWCGALGGFALSGSYALALALLFAAGFLELSFNAIAQTLVQLNAPAVLRGRIIGVFSMASLGLRMFSGITVGILGGFIGIHLSLAASATALAVFLLGLLVWHARLTSPARVRSGV
jgi:MFS family permease